MSKKENEYVQIDEYGDNENGRDSEVGRDDAVSRDSEVGRDDAVSRDSEVGGDDAVIRDSKGGEVSGSGEKRMLLIVNPCSGKGRIKNHLLSITDIFIKAGYQVQLYISQCTLDARRAAGRYGPEADLIVCSGGDGTLNEVVSGIMELEHAPKLGYIPAGSTNDFASSLHIPKNMNQAARAIVDGTGYAVDIGSFCGERYFMYVAGFGAFTEVSYLTPQDKKNVLGHQAYMLEGVKSLSAIKSYYMVIEWEEGRIEGDFIFGMVTNTVSVGGFKSLIRQEVSLDDGLFEVLLISAPRTPLEFSNIVSRLIMKEEDSFLIRRFKARRITFRSEEAVDWVLDGEFGGSREEVKITNLHRQIEILKKPVKQQENHEER